LKNSQILSGCFCFVPTYAPTYAPTHVLTFFTGYVVMKQKGPGNEVAGAFEILLVDLT
jgi:hypothetical protein